MTKTTKAVVTTNTTTPATSTTSGTAAEEDSCVTHSIYDSFQCKKDPVSRSSPSSGFSSGSFDNYYGVVINGSEEKCATEDDALRPAPKPLSNSYDSGRKSLGSAIADDPVTNEVQNNVLSDPHQTQNISNQINNENLSRRENNNCNGTVNKLNHSNNKSLLNEREFQTIDDISNASTNKYFSSGNEKFIAREPTTNELLSKGNRKSNNDSQISKAVQSTFQYIRSRQYLPPPDVPEEETSQEDDYSYCDISGTESAIFDAVIDESCDSKHNKARLHHLKKNYARLLARDNAKKLSGYSIGVNGRHLLKPLTESNGDCDEDQDNDLDNDIIRQLREGSYEVRYNRTDRTHLNNYQFKNINRNQPKTPEQISSFLNTKNGGALYGGIIS